MADLDLQNSFEENSKKLNEAFDQNASLVAYIFAIFATLVPILGTFIVRKDFAKENINKASGVALIQGILLFIFACIPFVGWFFLVPLTYLGFIIFNLLAVSKAYKKPVEKTQDS